jgi:outer membrane autotransporter protein
MSIYNRKMSGHRVALMLSTSILSMGAYGHLRSAKAANECGVIAAGGTATCTPAGNNFVGGIDYDVNNATVIVQDGVVVSTTADNTSAIANGAGGVNLGNLTTTTQGTVNLTTTGTNSVGISSGSAAGGSTTITTSAGTSITTSGGYAHGISAYNGAGGGAITITAPGTISTSGSGAAGIVALNFGGATTINTGNIAVTSAAPSFGIYSISFGSTIDVTTSGVSVTNGYGIFAISNGAGSGAVNITTTGAVATTGNAIYAGSQFGNTTVNAGAPVTATGAGAAAVRITGTTGNLTVTSAGLTSSGNGGYGILANNTTGNISLTDTGTITSGGYGIYSVSTGGATTINVNSIAASNDYHAIYAISQTGVSITASGMLSASGGVNADGINSRALGGALTIQVTDITASDDGINVYGGAGATVTTTGTITAGDEGMEVATGATGNALVTVNNVNATGADNDAIRVTAGGTATINVNGAVLGGSTSGAGAGIDVNASTATTITISGGGSVGSMSDYAIETVGAGATTINNSGTITGRITLTGNDDVINNLSSNSINLRRFTDTNADGVRDTEAVGVVIFGAGNDTFNNAATGTVRVSTVTGATAFNTANETFATGSAALSLTNAGVEQGHIVGLETFINSGILTLADLETGGTTAVAGDVLAITSLGVPGVGGTSNFISNGGQLHLDTVLDTGAVDTTDVLILDSVTTGPGGATGITITDAGGAGGITGTGATNGIRVVEVRGVGSASDAFTLSRAVVGGLFEYELNQADGQNWYLQSDGSFARQIPAYQALPLALSGFARDQMPWAQKRWGHADGLQEARTGAWLRGGYIRGSEEFGGTSQYESRDRFAQAGYDVVLDTGLPGSLSIGGLLQHTSTDTSVTNGNGSTFSASGYGAGLSTYWTTDSGLFLEALATLTRYEVEIDRQNLAGVADTDAYTYSAGLQIGHQFQVAGETDRWNVTPRASLTFIDSDIDNFTDASGIAVDFADSDSMLLEAGMISGLDLDLQGNRVLNLTAEIGIEHNLFGENSVTANDMSFSADRDNTRVTFGTGAAAHLGDGFTIFVRAEGSASLAGEGHSQQATAGARITF